MFYEGLKQNTTIIIIPNTAMETMQLGGINGLTALTMELKKEQAKKENECNP